MFDATAQDLDADANSLDSRNSFAGESRLGIQWKFKGAEALALVVSPKSISRASIRIVDVNYYARRSANCLIAWRVFDSDTILARRNIYIKSPLDQSMSRA